MTEQTQLINIERLMNTIEESAKIGQLEQGGIGRLALTDEDKSMRDLFVHWLESTGLTVRVDDFGNIYGRREGKNPKAAAVLIGSHLDTQPEGGRYDGILGVLSGFEVLKVLHENEIELERPIELVCFTNEEGARFEPPILGAGGLAGVFSQDFVFTRQDKDGKVFLDELKRIGYHGAKDHRADNIYSYLELHIEQGPVLEHEKLDIGVVTGIQGMNWLEVKVTGQADHAGPTPMNMRKDSLMAAAKMIIEIKETIKKHDSEATVTVGRLSLLPNSINCVPGEVVFSVDIRHSVDAVREHLLGLLKQKIGMIAATEQVELEMNQIWETPASHFSSELIQCISESAEQLGYSHQQMISGAGHDAKYINEMAPTAMIFVPSVDGKSHCQEEFTRQEAIEKGANVLLNVVRKLAI
ncbi:M20 family metallo-hydrolase [Peribacillus castrilensis]|uniref:N-carbamoyl-L-amino acid amidohydrolase n=1 Tax=Peribacillus simplex TaxID=1478 RepID=A0AAN2PIK0_9BACI|nr:MULTISPECIES: M20 family metallo-hydrolase [Bacillaceae]MCF7620461.1 M20 family metallo-hydrolase [Peribacillus frigoritolerans]MCP1156015.1 M20 family metallo-hydrolase [Peribacillus frigoritolerans]MCT1390415.1 M20 family metallo-hydrolase [Peribacillus frigoritolerans]PRA86846.1 Zn-dependent hydrolase [Peribacillus simplex]CEG33079.1 N-carbamoyl-L-amino acid amidohydrolase [Peribacillus simplex]